jgi:uncharacterized peroxidase-related enzyme
MLFIDTIAPDQANGDVKAMFDLLQGHRDYLPNYAKVFCYRPEVMTAWANLQSTIQQTIDHRRFELVTLAAAQTINSSYCSLAHGQVLSRKYYDDKKVEAIARDTPESPLDAADTAMMAFARKVARDTSSITQQDIDTLKTHGFDDAEIFDITATAAARCFFAKISDALGAKPDSEFMTMDSSLREALTVGRAIEKPEDPR